MIRYQANPARRAPVIVPCIRSLEERMAEDMREMAFAGENVCPETLARRGWPMNVTKRIGEEAAKIARRRSIRQVCEA